MSLLMSEGRNTHGHHSQSPRIASGLLRKIDQARNATDAHCGDLIHER